MLLSQEIIVQRVKLDYEKKKIPRVIKKKKKPNKR